MSGRQRAIDTTDLRSRAIFLNGEGFRVFPVRIEVAPDGHTRKIPSIERYHGDQPFQEEVIRGWPWSGANALGWALPTGYITLDIDVNEGKRGYDHLAMLEADLGALPVTRHQETRSGGRHLVFAVTSEMPKLPAKVPMVETVGNRKLVVGTTATSTSTGVADIDICHPGHRYLVLYQPSMLLEPVAELPEQWLKHIAKRHRRPSGRPAGAAGPSVRHSVPRALETLANAEMGSRNNTLNLTVLQNAASVQSDSDVRDAVIRHAEMAGFEPPRRFRRLRSVSQPVLARRFLAA